MRVLLIVVVALVLAGCGTEAASDDPSSAPSSRSPSPTLAPSSDPGTEETDETDETASSPAAAPCDTVSDRQVTRIAGTSLAVGGPEDVAGTQRCFTVVDRDDPLGLTWSFGEGAPLKGLVEAENRDGSLDASEVRLMGGRVAVLLTGEVVGTAFTQVVTVLDDDRSLVVEARDTGLGRTRLSVAALSDVATQVADAVSR